MKDVRKFIEVGICHAAPPPALVPRVLEAAEDLSRECAGLDVIMRVTVSAKSANALRCRVFDYDRSEWAYLVERLHPMGCELAARPTREIVHEELVSVDVPTPIHTPLSEINRAHGYENGECNRATSRTSCGY